MILKKEIGYEDNFGNVKWHFKIGHWGPLFRFTLGIRIQILFLPHQNAIRVVLYMIFPVCILSYKWHTVFQFESLTYKCHLNVFCTHVGTLNFFA